MSSDGRTPVSGVPMEAHDPANGTIEGAGQPNGTTSINGEFFISGLSDRAWVPRRVSGTSDIIIIPVRETETEDTPHGQRSTSGAHSYLHLRDVPSRFSVGIAEEGTIVGNRQVINFVGSNVTAVDDGINSRVNVNISGGGGSGNVTGPDIATDNAVARFDSTTGKVIQNSGVTIDDSGHVLLATSQELRFRNTNSTINSSGANNLDFYVLGTLDLNAGTVVVRDSALRIVDENDTTKKVAVDVTGISTGQTRTLTVQDVSGTVLVTGGTDVAVADGGTGASTAAAAATALGVGTGNSPQFTAVNIGHASDTTLARVSAGVASIAGSTVLVSGGALGTPAAGSVLTNCTGLPPAGATDALRRRRLVAYDTMSAAPVAGDEVAEYIIEACHITHIVAETDTGTTITYNVAVRTVNNAFTASGENLVHANMTTTALTTLITTGSWAGGYNAVPASSWIVIKIISLTGTGRAKVLVYGTPD